MIITEQKTIDEIIDSLKGITRVFLVGCGDCATVCKTGGQEELAKIKRDLEAAGKTVLGTALPDSTCVASQIKAEFAKNMKVLKEAEAVLVMACGLGTQSVKDNDRFGLKPVPGCNSLCAAVTDSQGNFLEKCSLCAECVLGETAGVCPVTLCSKSLLNGPCGGMNKGKCEVDKERDCAWVLIYKELEKRNKLADMKKIRPAKDHSRTLKPRKVLLKK